MAETAEVAWSDDGGTLVTAGRGETGVFAWDAATGALRWSAPAVGGGVRALAVRGGEVRAALRTGDDDGTWSAVRSWDLATGKPIKTVRLNESEAQCEILAFGPRGETVVEFMAGKQWDAATGAPLAAAVEPKGVTRLVLSMPSDSRRPGRLPNCRRTGGSSSPTRARSFGCRTAAAGRRCSTSTRPSCRAPWSADASRIAVVDKPKDGTWRRCRVWERISGRVQSTTILNPDAGDALLWPAGDKPVAFGAGKPLVIDPDEGGESAAGVPAWVPKAGFVAAVRSPDRRSLAVAAECGSVLVWELPKPVPAPVYRLVDALALIGSDDPYKAGRAVRSLVDLKAVDGLRVVARRVDAVPVEQVAERIAKLNDRAFRVREAATKELLAFGEPAVPALTKALDGKPTPEVRGRIEELLAALASHAPPREETRPTLRAIGALERIGTPEARKVLKSLAGGFDGARVTREAKDALDRLGER